eukprot:TRINITY_DN15389_c0_g1_i1.p1 TRINITY_DN15389_c0_g1~~TRINITY_DN15389_c0_g1_i1.p1  ORF type:complete len:555 (+),score=196.86 TRINITY_DN15389_c0_g1_i1:41-1705(+)
MYRGLLMASLVGVCVGQTNPVKVAVEGGSVTGYEYLAPNVGAVKFLGVPYAEPPVGSRRWESPVMNTRMGEVDAKELNVGCPQECQLPTMICPPKTSEDCLFLNIFTPIGAKAGDKLPVMFFIHGGNFFQGYGGGVLYDGSYYANSSNVIVVSINYRLGALGFLSGVAFKGNYGFEDQQVALKWVNRNIEAFGGDASQVTLWGQSAGAMSTAFHLTNKDSEPLFARAIMMSEPFALPFRPEFSAETQAYAFAKFLNCSNLDPFCMKSRTTAEVLAADLKTATDLWTDLSSVLHAFTPWAPTVNGSHLVDPTNAFYWGNAQDKPVIVGNVANEGRVFIWQATRNATTGQDQPLTPIQLDALELAVFQEKFGVVHERYPPNSTTDNKERTTTLATEFIFICANRKVLKRSISLAPGGRKSPVYYYLVDRPMSFAKNIWTTDPECDDYTCHGGDLPFAFAQMYNPGVRAYNVTFEPGEIAMSKQFAEYFSSFAKGEQPSSATAGVWNTFNPQTEAAMHFKCNSSVSMTGAEENIIAPRYDCDWWDTAVNMYNHNGPN